METLAEILESRGIAFEIRNDTLSDPATITQEARVNPIPVMGARRTEIRLSAVPYAIGNLIDVRTEKWLPGFWITSGDEYLICIIEIIDLGSSTPSPKNEMLLQQYYQQIKPHIPVSSTLIGCDAAYLTKDRMIWVAHTIGSEPYPLDPIHIGSGLDLVMIRKLNGTINDIANGMVVLAMDCAGFIDDLMGEIGYSLNVTEMDDGESDDADIS